MPLAIKIFLACAGLAFATSLVASGILYIEAGHALRERVREQLAAVAATISSQVNAETHYRIKTRGNESSSDYRKIRAILAAAKAANPKIRYVYTMRKTGKPGILQFVVDAETDSELMSHVGDEFDAKKCPELLKSFTGATADKELTQDKWGIWLSGYAPIRDARGNVDAIVGLDMSAKQLGVELAALRDTAVRNVFIALFLAVALGLATTRAALKTVRVFSTAANRVKDGDLEFQVEVSGSDEVCAFAESFNSMISGLKDSRDRLMEATSHDMPTGLYNHMYFHERLGDEIERAKRYKRHVSVMMIDLDRFKSVNDTLGHPVGNSVIRQLANVLRESVRQIDVVSRYGGDEFTIILPETNREAAVVAAENVRKAVEDHEFVAVPVNEFLSAGFVPDGRQVVHLSVTIGIASYPEDQTLKDGLIMAADIALCRAKHIQRNSVCSYDPVFAGDGHVDPNELYQVLHDPNSTVVHSLAAAVDAKDRYTCGHSERVADYALQVADAAGMDDDFRDVIGIAGLLHDLGKIGVPDSILNKAGALSREERDTINQHPSMGGNILQRAPHLDAIIPAILFHHERWDGAGYPNGLVGEQIPLIARIMAIADAFDAMTSDRPYRRAMSVEAALIELRAGAGKQFDPDLVEKFVMSVIAKARKAA